MAIETNYVNSGRTFFLDEFLVKISEKIDFHGRGSDLTEDELKKLIDDQVPKNDLKNRQLHRTLYQFVEMRTHQWYLSISAGFHIDGDHVAQDWIDKSYAEIFAKNYLTQLDRIAA